jgi:hypothetical protein
VNRKDESDGLRASHKLAKLICSDSEPKDKSDTRSVAFNEVESSDSEPKDRSDTRSVAFNEVESSDQ